MILIRLFEEAKDTPKEEDFFLTVADIKDIVDISDQEVTQLLLWMKKNDASAQKIDKDVNPNILWLKIHMEDVNLRTKMYCFVSYLSNKNIYLKPTLQKVLKVL